MVLRAFKLPTEWVLRWYLKQAAQGHTMLPINLLAILFRKTAF